MAFKAPTTHFNPGDPNKDRIPVFLMLLRYAAYTVLIFAATTSLPLILDHGNVEAFKEGGWIECSQLALLLTTSLVYFCEAVFSSHHQKLFIFLGCIAIFATIRELDSLLDTLIPLLGWKIGYVFILLAIFSALKYRKVFLEQLAQFLATHSVVVLWAGFLIAVPLGQLVGHGDFLQTLMGDDYLRDYKRVLEETFEVMGYILMLAGTVEAAVELRCPSANKAANQQKIAITEPRIHLGI